MAAKRALKQAGGIYINLQLGSEAGIIGEMQSKVAAYFSCVQAADVGVAQLRDGFRLALEPMPQLKGRSHTNRSPSAGPRRRGSIWIPAGGSGTARSGLHGVGKTPEPGTTPQGRSLQEASLQRGVDHAAS